jgi:hypothetical protein
MSIFGDKQELNIGCLDTIVKNYKIKVIEQRRSNESISSSETSIPEEKTLFLDPVP